MRTIFKEIKPKLTSKIVTIFKTLDMVETSTQYITGSTTISCSTYGGWSGSSGVITYSGLTGISGTSGTSGSSGRSGLSGTQGLLGTSPIFGTGGFIPTRHVYSSPSNLPSQNIPITCRFKMENIKKLSEEFVSDWEKINKSNPNKKNINQLIGKLKNLYNVFFQKRITPHKKTMEIEKSPLEK